MRNSIGIDRKIKRAWLDALLDRLVQTQDEPELRAFLDDRLKAELPGKESRAKSAGIVLRIWCGIPKDRQYLRDKALALVPQVSGPDRIWLHWGLTVLAYPFFRDAAEVVGRVLTLQDDFTTAHVQARLLTTWGDRATTKEASQKLLTTLVDWGVLRSTDKKGHFLLAGKMRTESPSLQLWMLETMLAAGTAQEVEAQQLLRLPEAFPFALSIGVGELRKHDGFHVHRQGLDMEMVARRVPKAPPPPVPAPKKAAKRSAAASRQLPLFDGPVARAPVPERKPSEATSVPTTVSRPAEPPPPAQPVPPVSERDRVAQAIQDDVARTALERADRFLQAKALFVVPDGPFAAPLAECAELFRDGHYHGCIALTQAVIEAIVRHVWQAKLPKRKKQPDKLEDHLAALHKASFMSADCKSKLDAMWSARHAYTGLDLAVPADRQALYDTALTNLRLLGDLEQELFPSSLPQPGNATAQAKPHQDVPL